jgi:hypothetical protein
MADKDLAYSRILELENLACKRQSLGRSERYDRNREYYFGDNLPPDNVDQPLGINLYRPICDKHNSYLWGEWAKDIVNWTVTDEDGETDDTSERIRKWIYRTARYNDLNNLAIQVSLDAGSIGDGIFYTRWNELDERVVWERIDPESFHASWSPSNPDDVRETIVSYPITRSQADHMYATRGNPQWGVFTPDVIYGNAVYWEWWTPFLWKKYVDDVSVWNKPNPYTAVSSDGKLRAGVIPFVHIYNLRCLGEFFGYADAEGMQLLQDELNRKMADQGDAITNYAHPITVVNGYYGEVEELPTGADSVWDLGKEGKATLLVWDGPSPQINEYITTVRDLILECSSMSSISFGRHKGTQQSAIALAIEMLPVTERARWKRAIWSQKLRSLIRTSAFIQEKMGELPGFTYRDLIDRYVTPQFAPILPRDRLALVNENIALFVNHLRTIKDSLIDLGSEHPEDEEKAILEQVERLVKIGVKMQSMAASGSSSLPEGNNKNSAKGE